MEGVKEDLGFGCVCSGAPNCLSMQALKRKETGERERESEDELDNGG